jgi:predicted nucleic acid-binding protein
MSVVFADTSYFVALVGQDDEAHELALDHTLTFDGRLVTTRWVLIELANHLAEPQNRQAFLDLPEDLESDPRVNIVPATDDAFDKGVELYQERRTRAGRWSIVFRFKSCEPKASLKL